jgi:hypothetical protein
MGRDGERWTDLRCIYKVELTRLNEGFVIRGWVRGERGRNQE